MGPKSKKSQLSLEELDERILSKITPLQEDVNRLIQENNSLRETNNQLIQRLSALISTLEKNQQASPVDDSYVVASAETTSEPVELSIESKSNTLILSDSIFRHVLSSCPKQPGQRAPIVEKLELDNKGHHSVQKIIVPGARADRLWSEAASLPLSVRQAFTNVIVSVGANHTEHSPDEAAADIQDFLQALPSLFPSALFAWSVMLPQPGKIYGIRYVNELVSAFCHENNFDLLWTNEYSVRLNGPDSVRSLFARDGVHLNRGGIAIMSKTVKQYIFSLYKY